MENKQRKKSIFDRFIIWLLLTLRKSFIGKFFTSYDRVNDKFVGRVKESNHKSRKRLASLLEKNPIINFIPKITELLMRVPLRDYGIMMFMTGAVVTVLYPINDMILFINVTFDMFVLGTATCVCSIPLLFSSRSLAENILSSRLFSYILFEFLGVDSEGFRIASEKSRVSFATFAFLIGAGLGVASYFIMPTGTLLILLGLVLAYSTVKTPEIGAVTAILLIPFINIYYTCICIAYTFVCYIIKVLLGKRIFKFEYFDLWFCIAIFVLLICGINYKNPLSSISGLAVTLIVMLSYFLFTNLIYSKVWFKRSIVAFTTSSLIVGVVAVLQAILSKISESVEALKTIFPPNSEITSTLGNSGVLANFMVVAIPFALVHMISERNDVRKFGGFLLSALLISSLILAGTASSVVGLLVGMLLVFAFFNRRAIYVLLLFIIAIPVLYFALPDSAIEAIFSFGPLAGSSANRELIYFKETFMTLIKYPFGLNISGVSFEEALGAEYADGLLLQLLASYGIIGAVAFIMMLLMFVRLIMSYSVQAKNAYRRVNGCAGLCSILAILAIGCFNYAWNDKRIFLLFIVTMALSFAYIKIDKEEELVSMRYVDISVATVDIPLREAIAISSTTRRRYVHAPRMKRQLQRQENDEDEELKEFSNTDKLFAIKRKDLNEQEE